MELRPLLGLTAPDLTVSPTLVGFPRRLRDPWSLTLHRSLWGIAEQQEQVLAVLEALKNQPGWSGTQSMQGQVVSMTDQVPKPGLFPSLGLCIPAEAETRTPTNICVMRWCPEHWSLVSPMLAVRQPHSCHGEP